MGYVVESSYDPNATPNPFTKFVIIVISYLTSYTKLSAGLFLSFGLGFRDCISLTISLIYWNLQNGSVMDGNLPNIVSSVWPEFPINGNRQQFQQQWHFDSLHQPLWGREEDNQTFVTPENSLLTYDSSANSGYLGVFFRSLELPRTPFL